MELNELIKDCAHRQKKGLALHPDVDSHLGDDLCRASHRYADQYEESDYFLLLGRAVPTGVDAVEGAED